MAHFLKLSFYTIIWTLPEFYTFYISNTLLVMNSRNNPKAQIRLFEEENAVT